MGKWAGCLRHSWAERVFKKDANSSLEAISDAILRLARHHRLNKRKYKIHVCRYNIYAF